MSSSMRVLIGGGSGFIGRHLRTALQGRGHDVTVISRTTGPGRITWSELESNARLPACDAVVNVSGENILQPGRRWTKKFQADVRSSRIDTSKLLVKLMTESEEKPKVWVSGHAVGYYNDEIGNAPQDEDCVIEKSSCWMQQLCLDWEESAKLSPEVSIRHVAIRTGVVLGKDGGAIQASWWPFYFGTGGIVGSGKQICPWIHLYDMVNLLIHSIENENVSGVLNGVAPCQDTNYQFTKAFGKALYRPTIFPMPEFVLNTAFGPDRARVMLLGPNVVPKRVLESGFEFKFKDIDIAMHDVVNS